MDARGGVRHRGGGLDGGLTGSSSDRSASMYIGSGPWVRVRTSRVRVRTREGPARKRRWSLGSVLRAVLRVRAGRMLESR
jgi:hypothetical protein